MDLHSREITRVAVKMTIFILCQQMRYFKLKMQH